MWKINPNSSLTVFAVALTAVVTLAVAVIWARDSAIKSAINAQRAKNLIMLYVALQNYSDKHSGFPSACESSDSEVPAHSWRVLLLPYLDQNSLYSRIRFDESWDSPDNSLLLPQMPLNYRSPIADTTQSMNANYFAVKEPHSPWSNCQQTESSAISHAKQILIVEMLEPQTPWMKPYDPSLEELLDLLCPNAGGSVDRTIAMEVMYITVDGEVKTLSSTSNRNVVRNILLGTASQ